MGRDSSLSEAIGVADADWDSLALLSRNIFCSREWLETWWRHQQADLELVPLKIVGNSGELMAVWPLVRARRRPQLIQPLGQWPVPALGVVCAEPQLDTLLPLLRAQLSEIRSWDLFRVGALPVGAGPDGVGRRGRSVALDREPNLVLDFDGASWDQHLSNRSRSFRDQIKRRERRLQKTYRVNYRQTVEPDRLDQDFSELMRLHELRWGSGSVGLTRATEQFHRQLLRTALDRQWLSLWFLELDGRPVAANLNFRFAGVEVYYQAGRDPAYDQDNVGLALLVHTIAAAADAGMSEFRFLRGDQEYKRRLANRSAEVELRIEANSAIGTAALKAMVLRRTLLRRWAGQTPDQDQRTARTSS